MISQLWRIDRGGRLQAVVAQEAGSNGESGISEGLRYPVGLHRERREHASAVRL